MHEAGNEQQREQPPKSRAGRFASLVFVVLAIGSAAAALLVQALAAPLDIPAETARLVATAFIIASALDVLVLASWERLFGPDT